MAEEVAPSRPSRSRRGHGEGTISKRKDGRWEARVDLGWIDGRRVRRAFYGATRAEVAEKLRKALELLTVKRSCPTPNSVSASSSTAGSTTSSSRPASGLPGPATR